MAADIHALEIEFAKNPNLDACIPLCEAYLEQKRFMEAMVVCKKGIKSEPGDPRGRVMLGRVYLEQGKQPKAEQELAVANQDFAGHPLVLELAGEIAFRAGQQADAVAKLQQALQGNANLPRAQALLAQMGVQAQAAAPLHAQPLPPQQAPGQPAAGFAPQMAAAAGPPPAMAPPPQGFQPQSMPAQPPMVPQAGQPPPVAAAPWAQPAQGMPAEAGAPAPMSMEHSSSRPLEHVSDFFAADALGFANTDSSVETAGPGRLTIIGFVPKATGSLKTTFFVLLGLFAIGGAYVAYTLVTSQNVREINSLFGKVRLALDEDKYVSYKDALRLGGEILQIDSKHALTRAALAYAEAVLAVEHHETGSIERAKEHLAVLKDGTFNEFNVPAQALISFAEENYDSGLEIIAQLREKGGSTALIELEAFRLMYRKAPADPETELQMRRLRQAITSETRALSYLGWHFYAEGDWASADRNFTQANQKTKGHPQALLGSAITDLDRGIGLKERQQEIEKLIKQVFAIPQDELSKPVLAMAHFVRARLRLWQEKGDDAESDFKKAFELDPKNSMFNYTRGVAYLGLGDYKAAIDDLQKAATKAPNDVRLYRKLAEAQMGSNDLDGAKASLARAAEIAKNNHEVKLLEAELMAARGENEQALAKLKTITRDHGTPAYAAAQISMSSVLRNSGKRPQAVKLIEDFLTNAPSDVDAETQAKIWCELGLNFEAVQKKDQAMGAFQSGIEQYRFYPDCHYYLCRTIGRGPAAQEACKAYLQLDPRGKHARDANRRVK